MIDRRNDRQMDGQKDAHWQIDMPFLSKLEHKHEYIIYKRNNKRWKGRSITIIGFRMMFCFKLIYILAN